MPIALAGNVLVSIQSLFTHIGEYLVSKELRLQSTIDPRLSKMFDLIMNQTSGITIGSSVKISTSGIIDDAMLLLERTLTSMGSGAGGYWIEDTFEDSRYRKFIADDIIALAAALSHSGFYIKFGSDSVFDIKDTSKIEEYVNKLEMKFNGAVCGILHTIQSRSGKGAKIRLLCSNDNVRVSFNPSVEGEALPLIGKAVIVAGRISYSDGKLSEVSDIGKIIPLETIKFRRIISSEGDISLSDPISAKVSYDNERRVWTIRNSDLGISVAKEDWDNAVASFHDQFVFVWNMYKERTDSMSSDELEVHDFIVSLIGEE